MSDKQTLAEFYRLRPELDVRANDGFLIEQAEKPISIQTLAVAATQLERMLLLTPAYQSAWDEFVYYNPSKNNQAIRREFLDEMRAREEAYEYTALLNEIRHPELRGKVSLPDLREYVAVQRENARRKSLSVPELREISKTENPKPMPDALPQFYVPIGKTEPVELTAENLRRAGTRTGVLSTADIRFLIRRWGSQKVNERLGAHQTKQPGIAIELPVVE